MGKDGFQKTPCKANSRELTGVGLGVSSATLTGLRATLQGLVESADAGFLRTLGCAAEVARDQSNDVADLEACGQHAELEKPAEKAVLDVRGVNQNQNDGEPASGNKNKPLEEMPKNYPK